MSGGKGIPSACARYADRLGLGEQRQAELLRAVAGHPPAEAMARLHGGLAGTEGKGLALAERSLAARLSLAGGELPASNVRRDLSGRPRLLTAPPIRRTPMAPSAWPLRPLSWPFRGAGQARASAPQRAGRFRRITLAVLILAQTLAASWAMIAVLPYHGTQPLEILILALFAILFAWVSAGFWTALTGFALLLARRDRHAISAPAAGAPKRARTAVVMPICNEDVARVFAGLRATYESLRTTGEDASFDFFILSDSGDPALLLAEVRAWLELCRAVDGFGRIFYRRRRQHIKKKSGNIADFCRRWGADYRYMVVLDADSVMSGHCLKALVGLMEANPKAGIIQTAPRSAGRETLHARIQQFASRVYGPLFVAGMHFWQLGEAHYWGHNAIIRVAPFMRHCALGRLPRGRRTIEIMSHDFVEAALMRRAGWGVWIAYDLPGSYEEMPPNLLDELQRDRRWCLGNLINARLFFAEGLHAAHRAVFATGIMAYLSAPLWFVFLLLSTLLLALHTLVPPQYFVHPYQLFPIWPEWHRSWATTLTAATALVLALPKLLAVLVLWLQGTRDFGGALRLALGVLLEFIYSMLLAPIRMLRHTRFVFSALFGRPTAWKSPPRADAETGWGEAVRRHGLHTLLGIAWAAIVYALNPAYLWWLLPVVGAMVLSIPLSVWSSRVAPGRRLRRAGLFLIPEESRPPPELQRLESLLRIPPPPSAGWVDAVVDPLANAIACAAARERRGPGAETQRRQLVETALKDGPAALSPSQRLALLDDWQVLSALHFEVWSSPNAHADWRAALDLPPCTAAIS